MVCDLALHVCQAVHNPEFASKRSIVLACQCRIVDCCKVKCSNLSAEIMIMQAPATRMLREDVVSAKSIRASMLANTMQTSLCINIYSSLHVPQSRPKR